MNYYSLSSLINFLIFISLGIFVLYQNRHLILYRLFFYASLAIGLWSLNYFLWQISTAYNDALFWCKGLTFFTAFIPPTFIHFVGKFTKQSDKFKLIIFAAYVFFILFASLAYTDLLVIDVSPKLNFPFWPNPGPLYLIFMSIFISLNCYSISLLIRHQLKTNHQEKLQNTFLVVGAILGFSGGFTNFPLWYNIPIPPYGNILVSVFYLILAYAILKHQLLGINIIIKKSLVYSSLLAILSIIYIILIVIFEGIVRHFARYNSFIGSFLAAITIALIFAPLKNKVQFIIDQYLFKGTPSEIYEQNVRLLQTAAEVEKYKSLSTLSSGMAHEIKNPLTAIKTFCEFLPKKIDDKEFLMEFSRIVGIEVNRINDLVLQLMEYSKPAEPELKPVVIHTLLDDTCDFLKNHMNKYKIQLVRDFKPSSTTIINLDKNQFRQALLNIILNAIDSMESGGTLTIRTQLEENHPHEGNPKLIIEIMDTGKGIPQDQINRIFEPFYSQKPSGTGLGLPISKTTIENHHGEIQIKSSEGHGTTAIIILPA